jgi:hypothetical protein
MLQSRYTAHYPGAQPFGSHSRSWGGATGRTPEEAKALVLAWMWAQHREATGTEDTAPVAQASASAGPVAQASASAGSSGPTGSSGLGGPEVSASCAPAGRRGRGRGGGGRGRGRK